MIISNLLELINAKVINETKLSKVSGFSTNLKTLERANAFFTNSDEDAKKAAILGAYAIISSKDLSVVDSDIAYLKVDNLDNAFARLVNFLCSHKEILIVSKLDLEFLKRLNFSVLDNDLFCDFEKYFKNDLLFSQSKLNLIDLNYKNINASYQIIKSSSFFYHDLKLNDEFVTNVFIPKIFIPSLAMAHFLKLNINNLKLLDFVFFNDENEITKLSEASKVVFFEDNDLIINEMKKHINLIEITKMQNYNYMLFRGDKQKFLNSLKIEEKGLF